MQENNGSIRFKELEIVLNNYLSKKDVFQILKSIHLRNLFNRLETFTVRKNNNSKLGKLEYIKTSDALRTIINFAEEKISKIYLLNLMLDLTHLMILKKEFKQAAEIGENMVLKIDGEKKFYKLEVDAYIALAEIAWNLDCKEQSEQYLEKSYEIYHSNVCGESSLKFGISNLNLNQFINEDIIVNETEHEIITDSNYYSLVKAKTYIIELLNTQLN